MEMAREAYYAPSRVNLERSKTKFNQNMPFEVKKKIIRYKNENNLAFFDKMIMFSNVLCEKIGDDEYRLKRVFS